MPKHAIVELFAGISGLGQGFVDGEIFEIQGLLDLDPIVRDSFLLNYPGVNYLQGNVRSLAPKTFLDRIGGERPFAVLGCPPCQGLSAAGKRSRSDSRNRLLHDFLRYVQCIQPKVFVLENVPQILKTENYAGLIVDFAQQAGYNIWKGVMNCALYGLPQTRQRAIVIGYHNSTGLRPRKPKPTHYGNRKVFSYDVMEMVSTDTISTYERALGWYPFISGIREKLTRKDFEGLLGLLPLITVKDALGDLPKSDGDFPPLGYPTPPSNEFQVAMRSANGVLSGHVAWNHSQELRRRMATIEEGSVEFTIANGGRSARYFSQAYGRLHRNGLARTITGNFHNPGCGRFVHYSQNRTLTVREALRLQGFDDNFRLSGSLTAQRQIVGNAFPKPLARAISLQIAKDFSLDY